MVNVIYVAFLFAYNIYLSANISDAPTIAAKDKQEANYKWDMWYELFSENL